MVVFLQRRYSDDLFDLVLFSSSRLFELFGIYSSRLFELVGIYSSTIGPVETPLRRRIVGVCLSKGLLSGGTPPRWGERAVTVLSGETDSTRGRQPINKKTKEAQKEDKSHNP
jgi:hypothetical protein